jgi:hypothetical protein
VYCILKSLKEKILAVFHLITIQRALQIADEYAELDVAIAKKAMQGIG